MIAPIGIYCTFSHLFDKATFVLFCAFNEYSYFIFQKNDILQGLFASFYGLSLTGH